MPPQLQNKKTSHRLQPKLSGTRGLIPVVPPYLTDPVATGSAHFIASVTWKNRSVLRSLAAKTDTDNSSGSTSGLPQADTGKVM